MKLAITALLAGSAAAFAPAQSGRVATDLAVSELEVRVTKSDGLTKRLAAGGCFPLRLSRQHACMIGEVPMVRQSRFLYTRILHCYYLSSERIVSRYSLTQASFHNSTFLFSVFFFLLPELLPLH